VSDSDVLLAGLGSGNVVTVDTGGCVRLWETGLDNLQRSLMEWRNMIGSEDGRPIQITVQRDSGLDVSGPKHGKVDAQNTPHVGGNQWAGGTGGRDTAGLGGKGGPYRLDAGHKVHQVSQAEKDAVPEEVRKAALRRQVQSLRIILDSLQLGSPQQHPKRLRVLVDVSGSMYRFNGVDGRLERSMEAVCMVMEALDNYEHKLKYDIVGHSGDGCDIELVGVNKIPKNNKERLKVNAFAVFIGSLGDQAERLQKTLPAGRSFVAMDTKQIPQILQQIFTSTMLSSG
ncbi:hypothetical protein CRUP_020892, partial [Coryphaenoides rupestris]